MATAESKTKKPIKKTSKPRTNKEVERPLELIRKDPYLLDYAEAIKGRHEHALDKLKQLTNNGKKTLTDFANGHNYYGFHTCALNILVLTSCTTRCAQAGILSPEPPSQYIFSL